MIIDATNLNPKIKTKWMQIAEQFSIEPEWKEFTVSYEVAVERDKNRERTVGENVIKDFYSRYYPEVNIE